MNGYEQLTLDLWGKAPYATVYINGRKHVYEHHTILTYYSICNLAGQPYHSTVVYHHANAGRTLTHGMCLAIKDGMRIDCIPTTSA